MASTRRTAAVLTHQTKDDPGTRIPVSHGDQTTRTTHHRVEEHGPSCVTRILQHCTNTNHERAHHTDTEGELTSSTVQPWVAMVCTQLLQPTRALHITRSVTAPPSLHLDRHPKSKKKKKSKTSWTKRHTINKANRELIDSPSFQSSECTGTGFAFSRYST